MDLKNVDILLYQYKGEWTNSYSVLLMVLSLNGFDGATDGLLAPFFSHICFTRGYNPCAHRLFI